MYNEFDTDVRLLEQFRNRFNRLFSDVMGQGASRLANGSSGQTLPPVNCWEDEGSLFVECELPGVSMDQLELTVVGRDLTIKGERKRRPVEGATFHRQERGMGFFHRVVRLPVEVAGDKVRAELRLGVLTVTLPKAPEARPRKIEVKCLTK